jgi:very-short-patch-repair endonuclease
MATSLNARVEEWRSQLLDTSKRNRLISLNLGRAGVVKIVHPGAERLWTELVGEGGTMSFPLKGQLVAMAEEDLEAELAGTAPSLFDPETEARASVERIDLRLCVESPRLRDDHVLTDLTDKQLRSRLGRLALNAKTSLTEQGVPTLYLTFGLLKWFESPDSQVQILSPLLLFPVEMERENVESPWGIKLQEEEVLPNHSLAQLMSNNFAIRFSELPDDEDSDSPTWRLRYFAAIQNAIRHQTNWEILDECTLGIFSFQKIAMWDDLGKNQDQIIEHDLCRAVAGDQAVRLKVPEGLPKAQDLDAVAHPTMTYHILDSDSSQHEAIEAAKRGASLVLDGPPGTGKSQTIANIIAEFLAMGRSVLFVSEKAAALEVVKRRLDKQGLGDFCLECHSHKSNKKHVIDELGRCLNLPAETYKDHTEDLDRLFAIREALNAYVRALHEVRQPLALSAFQVHGRLAAVQNGGVSRCPVPDVSGMTLDRLRTIQELLDALPDCRDAIQNHTSHPWRGSKKQRNSLNLKADIEHHFERLDRGLARIRGSSPMLEALCFVPCEPSIPAWLDALELVKDAPSYPLVPAEWFQANPRQVAVGYVQLDQFTRTYRETREAIPEFSDEAVLQVDADALKALRTPPIIGEPSLLPHDHTTVLTLRSHLQRVSIPLRTLTDHAKATNRALDVVLGILGLTPRPLAARGIGRVQELLGLVGKVAPIRRSWLDAQKRLEIQKVIDRCRSEDALNGECRLKLLDRMLPRAFDPEFAALAHRSQSYQAGWKRLLPGWWILRGRLLALYSGGAADSSLLLSDMQALSEYHRRLDYARQVKQQYADHLIVQEDGETDWERNTEGLKACEQFDPLLRVFPELKDILIDSSRVDQDALRSALAVLVNGYRSLREAVASVSQYIDLGIVLGSEGKQSRMSADDFAEWLERQSHGLEAQLSSLGTVSELLKPTHDISLDELPSRLQSIETLRKCRARIDGLSASLRLCSEISVVCDRDWADLRSKADWTTRFLDQHRDHPPESLVRAATTPEIRQEVVDAVQANLASRTDEFLTSWKYLTELFEPDQEVSTGIRVGQTPLAVLHEWVRARREDAHLILEWVKFCEIADQITQAGLAPMLSELLDGTLSVDEAKSAFLVRFYRCWLDGVYEHDPILRRFATEVQERQIDQFRNLDRDAVRRSFTRIREARLSDPTRPSAATLDAPRSSELGTLLSEVNKKRRHFPLRQLFARIPTVLLRLKPCLMMSPLAVSTYLNTKEIRFDVVIFDEASQVRPYDAISSIYRGRQLVVAGDQKQLPPTTFFERTVSDEEVSTEEEEIEETLADFESILDVCCTLGLPRRRLRWHYRSRREPLIAFSNRHFYENELVTFPSVLDTGDTPAIRFEYLSEGRWKSGSSGGFNALEALKTAELVMRHFRTKPSLSLGVIAFSQRQQMAILDELERLRRKDSSLEDFFSEDQEEPFFVKSLENVQGDERDVIFLSIGYGPDENGRVAMRFGPLNRQGGERRLNVAVTRARSEMSVISSMRSHDIDLSRTTAVGAKLLRAYLDFAERGVLGLGSEVTHVDEEDYDSPFERHVAEALTLRGMEVRRQVGCSGYRIDLALMDPSKPGRFILGIECDGATYHNSATARDRDRLRQEVLESLGWQIVRIWSTDWVRDPISQINRVLAAFERRLIEATEPSAPTERTGTVERPVDEVPVSTNHSSPKTSNTPTVYYQRIEDVPPYVIRGLILSTLENFGVTEQTELTVSVARQLGFQRTGTKIRARIESCVNQLLSEKKIIRTEENGLKLNSDTGLKLA